MDKEPFHETLKKYRVVNVLVTVFLIYLTLDVWHYTKAVLPEINDMQVVPLLTAFSTLIAGLFATIKHSTNKIEKD